MEGELSKSKKIREWLKTQNGPRSSAAMAHAIDEDTRKVQSLVGQMLRGNLLRLAGTDYPRTYALAREPMTNAEIQQAANDGMRRKDLLLSSDERAKIKADAAHMRRERDRVSRAKLREKRIPAPRMPKTIAKMASRARLIPQREVMQPQVKGQSVDDWLAKGGRVERLPSMLGMKQ